MGQPRLGVQQRRGRLRLGADLAGGRSQGVGGLQVVAALHASAAAATVTDVDPELAYDRPAGNLGLELLGHGVLDEAALTVRAGVGERGLEAFVDPLRRRRGPMAVGPVRLAGLAAGGFRVRLGRPLAEGRGLPFADAQGVLKAPGQLRDLAFEFADALTQRLTIRADTLFHTAIVATPRSVSCASPPLLAQSQPEEALNKYVHLSSPGAWHWGRARDNTSRLNGARASSGTTDARFGERGGFVEEMRRSAAFSGAEDVLGSDAKWAGQPGRRPRRAGPGAAETA